MVVALIDSGDYFFLRRTDRPHLLVEHQSEIIEGIKIERIGYCHCYIFITLFDGHEVIFLHKEIGDLFCQDFRNVEIDFVDHFHPKLSS